ncbi:MAG: hypothetical protein ABIJ34_01555 [archaeon]
MLTTPIINPHPASANESFSNRMNKVIAQIKDTNKEEMLLEEWLSGVTYYRRLLLDLSNKDQSLGNFIIHFDAMGNQNPYYYAPAVGYSFCGRNPQLNHELRYLMWHLNGLEAELDTSNMRERRVGTGSNWNSYRADGEGGSIYRNSIHPQMRDVIFKLLELNSPGPNAQILDLFCAEGEFVLGYDNYGGLSQDLTQRFPETIFEYNLVDNNYFLTNLARRRVKRVHCDYSVNVIRRDILDDCLIHKLGLHPRIICAFGGLNSQVLTRNQALYVAEYLFRDIPNKTEIVLSGLTNFPVCSTDFRRIGFDVLNMSYPYNLSVSLVTENEIPTSPYQIYVLRKPELSK